MQQPTPRRPDRPVLWIVAGPNGGGKSSLYNRTDIEGWGGSIWIINPDLLTQQIVDRRRRSFDELGWLLRNVDSCHIFDNSTGEPTLVAQWTTEMPEGPRLLCRERLPPDLSSTLRSTGIRLLDFMPS